MNRNITTYRQKERS